MEKKIATIIILGLLGIVSSYPVSEDKCSKSECKIDNRKFNYRPGISYQYRYETNVSTSTGQDSERSSQFFLAATVHFDVLDYCEWNLRVSNVQIEEKAPTDYEKKSVAHEAQFKAALQDYPLRFSFQGGLVERICQTNVEEPEWSLNIKRGILSIIQNLQKRLDLDHDGNEIDVKGECESSYIVRLGAEKTVDVTKTKNWCKNQGQVSYRFQGVPYRINNAPESSSVVLRSSECIQSLHSRRYAQILCNEVIQLTPTKNSRGEVAVAQSLTFVQEDEIDENAEKVAIRKHIGIELVVPKAAHRTLSDEEADELVKEKCMAGEEFTDEHELLVSNLLEEVSLKKLHELIGSESCLQDGLKEKVLHSESPVAIAAVRDMILSQKVEEKKIKDWLKRLQSIVNPTVSHLVGAEPLIQSSPTNDQYWLAVSGLAGKLCLADPSLAESEEVKRFVKKISEPISASCRSTLYDEVMISLRSLANAGPCITDSSTFSKCLSDPTGDVALRAFSMESFRLSSCAASRDEVFAVYKNQSEPIEIRIGAFQAAIACANVKLIQEIRRGLECEESHQVRSYIVTFLKSMQTSSSPSAISLQSLIGTEAVNASVDNNFMKFSRNDELSFFSPDLDFGSQLQTSIVFAGDLFVPRVARVNLTADFLGRSYNVFELYLRAEGLENLARDYIFNSDSKKKEAGLYSKWNDEYRFEELDSEYEKSRRTVQGPKVTLYSRSFGKEIAYENIHNLKHFGDVLKTVNPFGSSTLPIKDSGYAERTFFDESLTFPTMSGIPLKIRASGLVKIMSKTTTEAEVSSFMQYGKASVAWNIDNRITVPLSAEMKVDIPFVESGISLTTVLSSKLRTKGHLAMKNWNDIDFKFHLPDESVKLAELSSEARLLHSGKSVPVVDLESTENSQYYSCIAPKDKWRLGMKLCAEASVSESQSGKSSYAIYLRKNAPSFTDLVFKHKIQIKSGAIHLDTKLAAIVDSESSDMLTLKGEATMKEGKERTEIRADVKAKFTDNDYQLTGGFLSAGDSKEVTAEISKAAKQMLSLKAAWNATSSAKSSRFTSLIQMHKGGESSEINIDYSSSDKKDLRINVVSPKFTAEATGNLKVGPSSAKGNMRYSYTLSGGKRRFGSLVLKDADPDSLTKLDFTFAMADNEELKNKELIAWTHVISEDVQGYSFELAGLTYTYSNSFFHKNLDKESFEFAFEASDTKAKYQYEAKADLTLSDKRASVEGHFLRGKKYGFRASATWSTNGLIVNRKDEVLFKASSQHGNLLTLNVTGVAKQPSGFSLTADGVLGEDADFKCQADFRMVSDLGSKQPKKLDYSMSVTGSKFERISGALAFAVTKDDTTAKFEVKHGEQNGVELKFEMKQKLFLGNGEIRLGGINYKTEVSYNEAKDELLADIHLDSHRDIWLRLHRNMTSSAIKRHVAEIKWDVNRDPTRHAKITIEQSRRTRGQEKTIINMVGPNNKLGLVWSYGEDRSGYTVDVSGNFGMNSENVFTMAIADQKNLVRFRATSNMTYPGFRDSSVLVSLNRTETQHDLTFHIVRDGSERLKLTSAGIDEQTSDSSVLSETASLYAPFYREEPIDLTFAYRRNLSGYACKLDVKLSEEKMLKLDTDWLSGFRAYDTQLNAHLQIVTPFPSIPRLNMGLNHISSFSAKFSTNNTVFVVFNDERHEAAFAVGLQEETASYGAKLSVGSPLIGLDPVTLAGFIRPSLTTPALQFELGMPGSTVVFISKVDRQIDGGVIALMSLVAPFLAGNKLEVLGEWNLGEKVVLKASALLGTGKGFRFESRYFFASLKNFDVGFILKTPWEEYENGGLLVQLAGDDNLDVVNGTVVGTFNSDEYTLGFFKEATSNGGNKVMKGELLIGLPRTEVFNMIGSYALGDEALAVNVFLEQGNTNAKFKLDNEKSSNKKAYQLLVSNSRLLPLPTFDVIGEATSLVDKVDENRYNQTNAVSLTANYITMEGKKEEIKFTFVDFGKLEPNDIDEEGWYALETLDFSSTFDGFESVKVKAVHDLTINGVMSHSLMIVDLDNNMTIKSELNFGEQKTSMEWRLTDQKTKKTQFYRITSKYEAEDKIKVNGNFFSSNPKYKKVPWTLEIERTGGSTPAAEEEGDYSEWDIQRDQPEEEVTEPKNEEPWSLSVKVNVKLPDKPLNGNLFVNGTMVDISFDGPEDGQIYMVIESSENGQFRGSAKIVLQGKELTASGLVEYAENSVFQKFTGSAKTPWESMNEVAVSLERDLEGPGSKVITSFAWDNREITANLGYMFSSMKLWSVDIQIATPFKEAETFTFIVSYSEEEKITYIFNIFLPRAITGLISPYLLMYSINHESTFENNFLVAKVQSGGSASTRSWELKFGADFNWDVSSVKLIADHDISVTSGDMAFATNGKAAYSTDDGNTELEGSLTLPGQPKLFAKADGQFSKETSDGTIEVGSETDPVKLSVNHDLTSSEKAARILVTLPNSEEYETQVRFDTQRLQDTKTSQVRIRSPISGLEDLQGDFLLKQNSSGFAVQTLIKSAGDPVLTLKADVDEDRSGRLKQYKGIVDLTSSMQTLAKLKAVYDKKYTSDENVEHELALTVNDFDESKWKYVKAVQQDGEKTKEVVELEGKYIIWPVALNYLFVKEHPTGKLFPSMVKRKFSIFDADEPKLRAEFHTVVETTEFGKKLRIEVAKVNLITKYEKKRGSWSHGTELQLDPDGSKTFGYEVQIDGTTIADIKGRLILIVPQRSFGVGAIVKSNDKSFGAQAEISWDVKQSEPRVMKVYFQIDDVQGNSESGKKWKLGLKHRHLQQDLLIEGDIYQNKVGNLRGSSEFRYLPGPEHRLRGTMTLSAIAKFPELEQKSGLTLTLPKAKLNTTMSQTFFVNLKKLHFDSSVYHTRDESIYTSSRSLDADRTSDNIYLYKASLPEGTYETVGTVNRANGNVYVELKNLMGYALLSTNHLNYTKGEYPIFKLYSSSNSIGQEDEVFDLVYQWNDDRSISLRAVSLSSEGISIPIYGHVALNTSHLFSSSLIWQPTLISDVKEMISDQLTASQVSILTFLVDTFFSTQAEISEIVDFVIKDMEQVIDPFKEDINGEVEKLVSDMEAIEELFETMYRQNDFLMKSVVGLVKILLEEYPVDTVLSEFKDWLAAKQEELTEGITSKTYDFQSWANDLAIQLENLKSLWTEKIYEPLVAGMEQAKESLNNAFRARMITYERLMSSLGTRLSKSLSAVYVELRNTSIVVASTIYDQLKPGFLTAADIIETSLKQITDRISAILSSGDDAGSGESFMEKLKKLEEKIQELTEMISLEKLEQIFDEYLKKLIKGLEKTGNLGTHFANILNLAQTAKVYLGEVWENNFEVTGDFSSVWEIMKSNIDTSSADIAKLLNLDFSYKVIGAFSKSATQTLLNLKEYRTKMVFVPEEGHFSLEQVLPFPWYSLKKKPQFTDLENNQLVGYLAFFTKDNGSQDSSLLYKVIDFLLDGPRSFNQSYDATAAIDLTGFVRTFHGNILDVEPANKCSYLLLRDFNRKSTSLMLEKAKKGNEGILTLLIDEYRVELLPNSGKEEPNVLVGGKAVTLPFVKDNLYISLANVTLHVKTADLSVSCRSDTKNCEVVGSGRSLSYYAGLLGRHDSDVHTDKTKPNGEKATDIPDLFSSWQVSKQCSSKPTVKPKLQTKDTLCSSYFESGTSGLANCYGFVDPKPYLVHCSDLAKTGKDVGRCSVVSAYETECRRKDVDVEIPADCLKCRGDDGTVFNLGETRKFTVGKGTKLVADVLFVIENGQCVKELVEKLQELVVRIDKELTTTGKMKNNRYGFLVYGKEAEVISLNQAQLFSEKNARDIIQHLKNTYPIKESTGPADLNALKEAVEDFPFRYYAAKSIVMLPCTSCSAISESKQKSFSSWLEMARIPVHVLFSDDFSFLKPTERRSIFGFDLEGGVTNKRGEVKKINNHRQLIKQATGICGEFTFKTNGTIFAAPRLLDQKSDSGKRALTAFARQLTLRSQLEKCQICQCAKLSENVNTKLICEACGSS